jgi:rhamnose transport system ATP-binding protein
MTTDRQDVVRGSSPQLPRLEVRGINKRFNNVTALAGVDMTILPGEIHALAGENGAGKSTLVSIITGVATLDEGEVLVDGQPVQFRSAADARRAGISTVYQDPQLFLHLTVGQNVLMGEFPKTGLGFVDRKRSEAIVNDAMAQLGVDLKPDRVAAELSPAELQFVAMARALMREPKLIILDEPTSSLTPNETERLFAVVRRLAARGTSVLLISHRLEEVRRICDRITVLRDGRRVATEAMSEISDDEIVRWMLGDAVGRRAKERQTGEHGTAKVLLEVAGLASDRFHDVSFALHAGEIVVIAGLVGSGRTEILETIMGLRPGDAGAVSVNGKVVLHRTPRRMVRLGLGLVPEERDRQGLVLGFGVRENVALPTMGELGRLGFLAAKKERVVAERERTALSIKVPDVEDDVASLSGGNRQKVVLAKWLAADPLVLILDEPTRGVDVGAKFEIHRILRQLVDERGLGALVVSSDLPEVVDLADRVLVMRAGTIVAELHRGVATEDRILAAATSSSASTPAMQSEVHGRSPARPPKEP